MADWTSRQSGEATIITADINDCVGDFKQPVQPLIHRTAPAEQRHWHTIHFTCGAVFIIMLNWTNALPLTAVACSSYYWLHGWWMQDISGWCNCTIYPCIFTVPLAYLDSFICDALLQHNPWIVPITALFDKHHVGTLLECLIRLPTMSQCLPAIGVRWNGCSCVLSQYRLYFHNYFLSCHWFSVFSIQRQAKLECMNLFFYVFLLIQAANPKRVNKKLVSCRVNKGKVCCCHGCASWAVSVRNREKLIC